MKAYLCIGTLVFLSAIQAFGLMRLGEGEITFNLQVESAYDSAIRSRGDSQEDFVFSFRPSLRYNRSFKNVDVSASLGASNRTYLDYDEYNDTDVFFDFNVSPKAEVRTSRLRVSTSLNLSTQTEADDATGEIVTSKNYGASGQVVYDPNRFYDLIGGVSYNKRDPDSVSGSFSGTETAGANLSISIPRSEYISWSGGVTFSDTSTDGGRADNQTMTYFVGLNGRLLSKLSGSISVGFQNRSSELLEDQTSPYASAGLNWQVDELSSVSLSLSQGLGTTLDDRASENFSVRLTANRQLSRDLSGSVYAGYDKDQYEGALTEPDRSDEEYSLGGSIRYSLVRWGSVGLSARYSDQSSTSGIYEFDRVRVAVEFNGTW